MQINGKTTLYAIVGNPVSHSLSPAMHNAAFQATGINGAYVPAPSADIAKTVASLRELGFGGASVTVPHKEAVMASTDILDPVAEKIGAVNTLAFRYEEGRSVCTGLNTDWIGSNKALSLHCELKGSRAVVLGAGGAAKAVAFGLLEAGAGSVVLANRTYEKAVQLAETVGCTAIAVEDLAHEQADILINTTSVGMSPHGEQSPIAASLLPSYSVVMDIVYAPLETRLLKEAKQAGCATVDGLDMLLYQGIEQFKIWTGVTPPAPVMRAALEEALSG